MSDNEEIHINQAANIIAAQTRNTKMQEVLRDLRTQLPGNTKYVSQNKIDQYIRKSQRQNIDRRSNP